MLIANNHCTGDSTFRQRKPPIGSVLICISGLFVVLWGATFAPIEPSTSVKVLVVTSLPDIAESGFSLPIEDIPVLNQTVKMDKQASFPNRSPLRIVQGFKNQRE